MRNLKFFTLCIAFLTVTGLVSSCDSSTTDLEDRVSQLEESSESFLASRSSTTTSDICTACKCRVTGLNCQCSIQKQYDCLKDKESKKPRLVFNDDVFAQASDVTVVDDDSIEELPAGENLLLDLTDKSVVYEVDVDSDLDMERIFSTSVMPLEAFLKETVNADADQAARYRISGNPALAFGEVIVETGCDGLPPSGCGTLACECSGDTECNRMFCSGKCKSSVCSGSGDATYCWCSTIFLK